jgi:hypothetical protein
VGLTPLKPALVLDFFVPTFDFESGLLPTFSGLFAISKLKNPPDFAQNFKKPK